MLLAVWVDNFLKYHPVAFEVTVPDGFVINGTTEDYIQRRVFEFGCWEPVIARMRSKRYAAIIEDGVIQSLDIDEGGVSASACEAILEKV